MKYSVHFMGYFGYTVEVEANSEEEAERLATPIFEETDAREFDLTPNGTDVWKCD